MKNSLTLALLLTPLFAQADIINCNFTEPFVTSSYSMAQQKLTYRTYDGEDGKAEAKSIRNVSFQIKGPGVFELVAKDGSVLQRLNLNHEGSDGMSDRLYPYTVEDLHFSQMANNGIGGCTSNYFK